MRRTLLLVVLAAATLAAAAVAALLRPPAVTRPPSRPVAALYAGGGTNLSAAFDAAAPELQRGRSPERVDKVFLASDGEANEGIHDRRGLLQVAQRDFGPATVSTFGIGEDYDEDLMSALAAQAGGRARFIQSPEVLPGAFHDELNRAASAVARGVRLRVNALAGAGVVRVLGY